MTDIKIITTADGSHSLFHSALNETYHSIHGASQESKYVFIQQGLAYFLKQQLPDTVRILEVGFGTGLNAWLTWQHALEHACNIHYSTIEKFPLPQDIWSQLNYATSEKTQAMFHAIHNVDWEETVRLDPSFHLLKLKTTLQDIVLEENYYSVIYFDAFAPNKQPEMWETPMLEKIAAALLPNGVFVTYCAKGQLKRDLKRVGLAVDTLPGPPGKKEMVRAIKLAN